VELVTTLIAAI